jgi:hypothetical protein
MGAAFEPTIDDVVRETRRTYDGPLVVGTDLMSFEIGKAGVSIVNYNVAQQHPSRRSFRVSEIKVCRHGVCLLDRGVVMSTAGSIVTVIGDGSCPQRRWAQ